MPLSGYGLNKAYFVCGCLCGFTSCGAVFTPCRPDATPPSWLHAAIPLAPWPDPSGLQLAPPDSTIQKKLQDHNHIPMNPYKPSKKQDRFKTDPFKNTKNP